MITTSKATKLDGTVVTEYRGLHNDMKPVTGDYNTDTWTVES